MGGAPARAQALRRTCPARGEPAATVAARPPAAGARAAAAYARDATDGVGWVRGPADRVANGTTSQLGRAGPPPVSAQAHRDRGARGVPAPGAVPAGRLLLVRHVPQGHRALLGKKAWERPRGLDLGPLPGGHAAGRPATGAQGRRPRHVEWNGRRRAAAGAPGARGGARIRPRAGPRLFGTGRLWRFRQLIQEKFKLIIEK